MQDRFKYRIKFETDGQAEIFDVTKLDMELGQVFFKRKDGQYYNIGIGCKDVELMQCTGLNDKYGKLIYEGDILELYVSTKKAYKYQVKYEIGSFMLVSNDEIFDFRNKWNDNVYPLSQLYFEYENEEDCIYQCEVIGNIYENEELLNGNNT